MPPDFFNIITDTTMAQYHPCPHLDTIISSISFCARFSTCLRRSNVFRCIPLGLMNNGSEREKKPHLSSLPYSLFLIFVALRHSRSRLNRSGFVGASISWAHEAMKEIQRYSVVERKRTVRLVFVNVLYTLQPSSVEDLYNHYWLLQFSVINGSLTSWIYSTSENLACKLL